MSDYDFDIRPLMWLCLIAGLAMWGGWELIDWLWIDEVIKSSTPLTPELEITVKDNVIDTIYIYRQP